MSPIASVAIETSCRLGGLALGRGRRLAATVSFDAAGRHATQLVQRLAALLEEAHLRPTDLDEVYVSAGPGSFTGLRVGITAVRTLAQAVEAIRCVAVPSAQAVAENFRDEDWQNLAVIMDSRQGSLHATLFARRGGQIVACQPGHTVAPARFLADTPRPLLLAGEGLAHQDLVQMLSGPGVTVLEPDRPNRHLPSAESIWRVGRQMADAGEFTDSHRLLPIYARQPEAVRLWEGRQKT